MIDQTITDQYTTEAAAVNRDPLADPRASLPATDISVPLPPKLQPWHRLFGWHFVILLAVITFFGAIRWRLLDMPLERDEGEYAYAGQLMWQGIPPYQLAYNMKLPGTYAAYDAILAGQDIATD